MEAAAKEIEVSMTSSVRCDKTISSLNNYLAKRKELKENTLKKWGVEEAKDCGCSGGSTEGNPTATKTDLIVLIDSSGSMSSAWSAVSKAVEKAIAEAEKSCAPDLRIEYFGVGRAISGTIFTKNHIDHITGLHGLGVTLAANTGHVGLAYEQGANAVEDLSKYMDWREGACRAIFYISDEELDSVSPMNDFTNETRVTNAAIVEANKNDVTVFAHHLTHLSRDPKIIQNYRDLCEKTGGELFISSKPSVDEYVELIKEAICNSCGKVTCKEIDYPEIKPCITINWGDSECDCIESSDHEVMSISVCNCYSNVTFEDFRITALQITDEDGKPVPLLPNGTPSVQLIPVGVHCFGNVEPCSCVTREFVLINEGAKAGNYKINIHGVCFDVSRTIHQEMDSYELTICKD